MSDTNTPVFNFTEGELLLIDKPVEWTSFDVVNRIRRLIQKNLNTGKLKVGHAGTLDPLATGLLLICTGKMTKKINELQDMKKQYSGTIVLGATTPSFDLETEIDNTYALDHIDSKMIYDATKSFTGEIMQTPPAFSAVKVEGERAYKLARDNKKVKIRSRLVYIYKFQITNISFPEVSFIIKCSKGTYIRSLVHEYGKHLKSGAYLKQLRRNKIGNYNVDDALDMEQIQHLILSLSKQKSEK